MGICCLRETAITLSVAPISDLGFAESKARIATSTLLQGFFFPLLLNPASPPLVDACATFG
jgi:hypothetical protein